MVSANDKEVVELHLSAGNVHDAPEGRVSIGRVGPGFPGVPVLMDRAYEGGRTRRLCEALGHPPVVPPRKNRRNPWAYDRELYKGRNVVERFFRRVKEFRRVNTRYDKLDMVFLSFVQAALIFIWIR